MHEVESAPGNSLAFIAPRRISPMNDVLARVIPYDVV
jgi:hypothetical protein